MKKVFLLFVVFFLLFGTISSSEAVVDRVVAVVNQEIITLSEVEKWAKPFGEKIITEDRLERREQLQEGYRRGLEKLIEEKMIDQEVKKKGIKIYNKEKETTLEEGTIARGLSKGSGKADRGKID